MAGLGIRLYTDEHIHIDLARALRERGYDAESCQEADRANQRLPDEAQLAYAARQGRAILTFDVVDYSRLEHTWKAVGQKHAGIILAQEITDFGTLLRRVQRHLDSVDPAVQDDTLLWLA
jgi:uncharacterized protein with PIN domain